MSGPPVAKETLVLISTIHHLVAQLGLTISTIHRRVAQLGLTISTIHHRVAHKELKESKKKNRHIKEISRSLEEKKTTVKTLL